MKGMKIRLALYAAVIVLATTILLFHQGRAQSVQATIDVHRPFLYSDTQPADTFGPSCAECHDPGFVFYNPQDLQPGAESTAPGHPAITVPAPAGASYSPIFSNDTLVGLWIGGQVGMKDLPAQISTQP